MKRKSRAVMLIADLVMTGLIAGCGQVSVFGHTVGENNPSSDVKSANVTPTNTSTPGVHVVKAVTVVLTPQAASKAADDPMFKTDALLAAIKSELQSRQLLNESDAKVSSTVDIAIDDYSMRPTSNVILFGNIISAGSLNGELYVRDEQGSVLTSGRIEAAARISVPAQAGSTTPVDPLNTLYRKFAVLLGDKLSNTVTKPTTSEIQPPR
jgi:hypothetical protein